MVNFLMIDKLPFLKDFIMRITYPVYSKLEYWDPSFMTNHPLSTFDSIVAAVVAPLTVLAFITFIITLIVGAIPKNEKTLAHEKFFRRLFMSSIWVTAIAMILVCSSLIWGVNFKHQYSVSNVESTDFTTGVVKHVKINYLDTNEYVYKVYEKANNGSLKYVDTYRSSKPVEPAKFIYAKGGTDRA